MMGATRHVGADMSIAEVLERARAQGRRTLTEVESKQVLAEAGIAVVPARLATTPQEAVDAAREVGFPIVLKVVSPDIVHKTDVGGVRLGLQNAEEVARAFTEVVESARRHVPDARIEGVSVQAQAPAGIEVILGLSQDPQFGPVLMFGLGGILVEVLKDVSFRIVPITPRDAHQMVREIRAFPVLQGYRGQPPADLSALEAMLLRLSALAEAHPEVAELDLNPVFAYPQGAVAVDARIVLS
jgi:acyl-CoA synthetase (NDP forming)